MTAEEIIDALGKHEISPLGRKIIADKLRSMEARLKAADELAMVSGRVATMNAKDLRDAKIQLNVHFALEAYRNAPKGVSE